MLTITKSIHIDAPVEKVFQYMDDPRNVVEIWPSLVEVRDVITQPDGKKTYNWTYKMFGVRLEGSTADVEIVPNQRMSSKSHGGVDSLITYVFEPENGGTKVTMNGEYEIPFPVLGKLAKGFVVKQNEREAETILENLKAMMEVGERVEKA